MAEEYTIPEELKLPLEIEVISACDQIDQAIEVAGDNEELVGILQRVRASICAVTPEEKES